MATTKKTTKSSSKAKPKSSSIKSTIKTAGKAAIIPGYGALTAAKKLDDYIQKKDPSLSKSKTYKALKEPAKKVKGVMDYASDKAFDFVKGARDVITNPGKYIEKGAAKIGKAAGKGMKAVDDYIEKVDPSLSKSKVYGAIKGVAKKAPKAIETGVGIAGKGAAMFNPVTGSAVAGREAGKGAKVVGKYAKEKIRQGAKAADDYVQKNDPNLSKSKAYGAVKSVAKSVLGSKSGSTSKKAAPTKTSAAKTTPAKTTVKTTPAKTTTTTTKSAPSVSELWKQKTGTSWSEAKKQGLTDGSASSNIALMKKLQSGSVNKNTVKSSNAAGNMTAYKKDMEKNVQDELSGKTTYTPPAEPSKSGADKAADENKMRRGGMVRRRMQSGGDTTSVGGGYVAKGNPGMDYKSKYKKAISKKPSGYVPTAGATKGNIPTATKAPMPTATKGGYKKGGPVKPVSALEAARALKKAYRSKLKSVDDKIEKRYPNYTGKGSTYQAVKDIAKKYLKTGGMVNSNSKVSAIKSAGSKGVMSGTNTRVSASKIARGRVGGTSAAPRTAVPKAKMGMSFGLKRRKK